LIKKPLEELKGVTRWWSITINLSYMTECHPFFNVCGILFLSAFPSSCHENFFNLLWKVVTDEDFCVGDVGFCERGVEEGLGVGAESRAGRTNVVGVMETTFGLAKTEQLVCPVI